MKLVGVRGVHKPKRVFTTHPDKAAVLPADLVNREFTAEKPKHLWVCDVAYVATWSGFACVAFVTDAYSRRIVGWNVAATLGWVWWWNHERHYGVLECCQITHILLRFRSSGIECDAGYPSPSARRLSPMVKCGQNVATGKNLGNERPPRSQCL